MDLGPEALEGGNLRDLRLQGTALCEVCGRNLKEGKNLDERGRSRTVAMAPRRRPTACAAYFRSYGLDGTIIVRSSIFGVRKRLIRR